jgi:SpoVK/Ycf46/Vps4 family AAA+-type ATPase
MGVIRKGDKVHVEYIVKQAYSSSLELESAATGMTRFVRIGDSSIVKHIVGELQAGDRVAFTNQDKIIGTILFVHEGRAWVQWDSNANVVYTLDRLIRV